MISNRELFCYVRNVEPDYQNFLRCCWLVGTKTAIDAMPHFLSNVHRDRAGAWARDIRLALATVEYVDSADFQLIPGSWNSAPQLLHFGDNLQKKKCT